MAWPGERRDRYMRDAVSGGPHFPQIQWAGDDPGVGIQAEYPPRPDRAARGPPGRQTRRLYDVCMRRSRRPIDQLRRIEAQNGEDVGVRTGLRPVVHTEVPIRGRV